MATELASAYVTLIPSLKGAQQQIQAQLSGINLTGAGKAMGSSLASGMSSAVSSAGNLISSTFGKAAKIGVGAISAIGTGIVGLAAKGGLSRALNLEQAQTMFKGLKLQWSDYEGTINAAVDGTAFSLDAAALVAANLAASGVGAGEQMETALNACVGAAATFGTDLGDIGGIFQKVAAKGKLSGDEIVQMSERGINATSVLAEYLGKSQDEVSKMVSSGKIDFQTFSDAMYSAFGESAQGANETFTGSLSNMRSSLNRLGVDFMTPFKDACIPAFNAVRTALNAVKGSLAPVAAKFGELASRVSGKVVTALGVFADYLNSGNSIADAAKKTIDGLFGSGTVSKITGLVSALGGIVALGPALKAAGTGMKIAEAAISGMAQIGGKLSSVAASVGGFVSKLGGSSLAAISTFGKSLTYGLVPQSAFDKIRSLGVDLSYGLRDCKKDLAESFSGAKQAIASKFNGIADAINSKFGGVPAKIGSTVSTLKSVVGESLGNAADTFRAKFNLGSHAKSEGSKLSAAFGKIKSAAGSLGGPLISATAGLSAVAGGLMVAGLSAVAAGVDVQGAANSLLANIQGLTANLPAVAQQFATLLPTLIPQITAALPALVQAFGTAMQSIVSVFPTILPLLVEGITAMVTELAPVLVTLVPLLLEAGLQLFTALLNSLSQILPVLIEMLPEMVNQVCTVLIENMPLLLEAGLTLFVALVTAFVQMTPQLISQLPALISSFTSMLISFLPTIASAAVTLFTAIATAIPQIAGAVLGALGDLLSQLPGKVTEFAGKMGEAAMQMIQGMVNGIGDAAQWVIDAIGNLCSNVMDTVAHLFGIYSPSRVMRKMFRYVGAGSALGIKDSIPAVVGEMERLVQDAESVAERFSPDLDDLSFSARAQQPEAIDRRSVKGQEKQDLIEALTTALRSVDREKDTTIVLNLDRREFMRWERQAV